jgi:SAM-dependent methyltransferase
MHDGWARYYDFVYDECFGTAFWRLTAETLAVITERQASPARVLDLGAGTGRIAIPLALLGYEVTAVEQSAGMADVLRSRAASLGANVDLRLQDFRAPVTPDRPDRHAPGGPVPYDVAVAIFTVLNYLCEEADVETLARQVAGALRPGGQFVFDLAARRLFAPALFESPRLHREITVQQVGPALFDYRDAGCGTADGQRFSYDELFRLRYWRPEDVLPRFEAAGLVLQAEITGRLEASGSRWFVLRSRA